MYRLQNFFLIMMIIIFIISLITICYTPFASLWDFNPTNIAHFNLKLFGTSCLSALISFVIALIIAKWDTL